MSEIGGYRELETWRVAMELVLEGYAFSKAFPSQEQYLLTSQLRRALVSIPSNIALTVGGSAGALVVIAILFR